MCEGACSQSTYRFFYFIGRTPAMNNLQIGEWNEKRVVLANYEWAGSKMYITTLNIFYISNFPTHF